jgi:hypothetical protein
MIYVIFAIALAGGANAVATNFYRTLTTTDGAPSDNVAFYQQRGASVLAASLVSASSTFVYYTNSVGGRQEVGTKTTLQTPDKATAGFGSATTFARDHITDNILFVSEVDSGVLNNGKVVYYRGDYSQWSVQQILKPPAEFFEQGFFGSSMDIDRYHLRTLAVGCKGCNSSHADSGSVYIFEATSPDAKKWTQMAELVGTDLHLMGERFAEIDRDVVVADAQDGVGVSSAVVYRRDPKSSQWSLQQVLVGRAGNNNYISVAAIDVFDETIVLGLPTDSSSSANHGSVDIFYPDTERFHLNYNPKAKPAPPKWSLLQKLYAPTPTLGNLFGSKVSVDGDRLAVSDGAGAGNYFYIYERDWAWSGSGSGKSYGAWSLQQRLSNQAIITDMELRGSSLAVVDGANLNVYDETRRWDCLLVSVEDHFSDGWDTARLVVETPDGDKDVFAQRCDTPNPFQFRYCPVESQDAGLYRFSIPDGAKAKFHWELLWRVYDEATGNWHTGNWDTKMDFEWMPGYSKFVVRKTDHLLPNNISCKACKQRPTSKPSARLRQLHAKDNTHAPTISPAPTIATSQSIHPWQELRLITSGSADWFEAQHKGTSYYIADKGGHRLLSTGTLCPWETTLAYKTCWEDYPDGDYVLRVGGGLDTVPQTFQFCHSTNPLPSKSQIVFRVSNGECSILSFAKSSTYCQHQLGIMQLGLVGIHILGVTVNPSGLTTVEDLIVRRAVATIVGARLADVKVVEMIAYTDSVMLSVEFGVTDKDLGVDFMNPEAIEAFELEVHATLNSQANNLWAAIVSGDIASSLQTSTGVEVEDVRLTGAKEELVDHSADLGLEPMVQEISDEKRGAALQVQGGGGGMTFSFNGVFMAAVSGWVLAAVGVAMAVYFVAFNGTRAAERGQELVAMSAVESDRSREDSALASDLEAVEERKEGQKERPVVPKKSPASVSATGRGPLSLTELYELVKSEDEALETMLQRCK